MNAARLSSVNFQPLKEPQYLILGQENFLSLYFSQKIREANKMVSRFKLGFHLPGVDVVIASFKNKEVVYTATVVAHDIADFESNYILLQRSG